MKLNFYLLSFSMLSCLALHAQTIITIAGCPATGMADGVPATTAALNNPYGIVIDPTGNIFFADRNNNRICKIDVRGIITTVAGTGKAGYGGNGKAAIRAKLDYPIGLALDTEGNLLFADRHNNRIRKICPATGGIITTVAGTGTAGYSGEGGPATDAEFNGPAGILTDAAGNIFVCDAYNNCIRRIDARGIITTIAGNATKGYYGEGKMAIDAELYEPYCMALDNDGNIFFTEYGNLRVRKINSSGVITTVAGNGRLGFSGDDGPATLAALNRPTGIAFDGNGNLMIADSDNDRIRKIDNTGIITTIAGDGIPGFAGDGGSPLKAHLSGPAGIAVDKAGNLYISDLGNNRIRYLSGDKSLLSSPAPPFVISISSDPATMSLYFEFKAEAEVTIRLMDLNNRQLVQQVVHNDSKAAFNVAGFSPGLYLYEVSSNGKKQTGKFRID